MSPIRIPARRRATVPAIIALAAAAALITAPAAFARAPLTNVNISFNEPAFPVATTNVTGTSPSYNVLRDSTGAKLASLPAPAGDYSDLLFTFSAQTGTGSAAKVEYQTASTGRFTGTHEFTATATATNSGARVFDRRRLLFAPQLTVTALSASLTSLNTAGIAWEFSTIAFLRPDGTYFSAAPTIAPYLSYSGVSGSPSTGWFVAASKGTVQNVGTASLTAAGADGPNDNLIFNYGVAGLAANTQIGGIEITSYLEDVRRTGNGSTTFTSSFNDVTISGAIVAVPEASTFALALPALGMVGAVVIARRRRNK